MDYDLQKKREAFVIWVNLLNGAERIRKELEQESYGESGAVDIRRDGSTSERGWLHAV